MKDFYIKLFLKLKLFSPIAISVSVAIFIITWQTIDVSKKNIYNSVEKNLKFEVNLVKLMLEHDLNNNKNLLINNNSVYENIFKKLKETQNSDFFILDSNANCKFSNNQHVSKDNLIIILNKKNGSLNYYDKKTSSNKLLVFDYFKEGNVYIVATVSQDSEIQIFIKDILFSSIIIGSLIILTLSTFVYFFTGRKLNSYVGEIEDSNKKLTLIREALQKSEEKFQTLFDNSTDEIFVADFQGHFLEVNKVACENLEYSRDEFLKMKFHDIKTPKFKQLVTENIYAVKEFGFHTYETENKAKSGKIFSAEMKSRTFDYNGQKVILSISRNITERKALEKKIVTTIIETEEKERKRFAADLHDGLGPILSTIKLYSDLLKKGNFTKTNPEELLTNIDELVTLAISTTKEISNNITPNILHDFGLASAIHEFSSYVNKTKSIKISVKTDDYHVVKRDLIETILYQTTKELINNTLKHAFAENIKIELKSTETQVLLYYRDDGIGFDVDDKMRESLGLGLNNIANKIKTIKGTCDFNSEKGNGMFLLIAIKID